MKRTFRNVTGDAEFHNPKNWDPEGEPVSGDELTFKPGWAEKVRDYSRSNPILARLDPTCGFCAVGVACEKHGGPGPSNPLLGSIQGAALKGRVALWAQRVNHIGGCLIGKEPSMAAALIELASEMLAEESKEVA